MALKDDGTIDTGHFVINGEVLAGEDMSRGDVVVLGTGSDSTTHFEQATTGASETILDDTEGFYQEWTPTKDIELATIQIWASVFQSSGSAGAGFTLELRSGSPTGTILGTVTKNLHNGGVAGWYSMTFGSALSLTANTKYYITVFGTTAGGTDPALHGATTDVYTSHLCEYSTNSGSTYAAHGSIVDLAFRAIGSVTTNNKAHQGSVALEARFMGLLEEDVLDGAASIINNLPVFNGFTGLTIGQVYYIGENGALATTGSYKLGMAVSATTIVRDYQ